MVNKINLFSKSSKLSSSLTLTLVAKFDRSVWFILYLMFLNWIPSSIANRMKLHEIHLYCAIWLVDWKVENTANLFSQNQEFKVWLHVLVQWWYRLENCYGLVSFWCLRCWGGWYLEFRATARAIQFRSWAKERRIDFKKTIYITYSPGLIV